MKLKDEILVCECLEIILIIYQVIVVSDAKNDVKSREQFVSLQKRNASD